MSIKNGFSIILFILAAVYFVMAFNFKLFADNGVPGNGFFPQIIGGILVLLTAIDLIKGFRENNKVMFDLTYVKDLLILTLFCFVYFALFGLLGALISTIIFTVSVLMLFNRKGWKMNLAIGCLLPAIVYIGFEYLLQTGLPSGIFENIF